MKNIFAFALFIFSMAFSGIAQTEKDYKDLLSLYVDEKYEKCLYKAEGYTLKDETKKDALPYLFTSMCYFEISKLDEFKEKYPDALKNAMKYLSKYGAKDKEKKYVPDYEDFFAEIRTTAMNEAESQFDAQKFTKSKTLYDQLIDLDELDAGAHLMLGLSFAGMKSKKESEVAIKKAMSILLEKSASKTKEQLVLLKNAIMLYAGMMNESGNKSTAKEWLDLGLEYFKDDKEYMVTYDTIAG
jgi:tetratricopeptide (TPR) repeat protein